MLRSFLTGLMLLIAPLSYAEETEAPSRNAIQEVDASGLSAWLIEDNTLPLVTLSLRIEGAGSASDVAPHYGRAAMAARLLKQGAAEYDAAGFTKALESRAIQLSMGVSKDAFSLTLKTTKDALEEAFRLTGLALGQANFQSDDVARIRNDMLASLRAAESSPNYHAGIAMRELLYGEHAYTNPPYGSSESLNAMTGDLLKEYTKRYLTKDRAIISVVGDISAAELAEMMGKYFGGLPEIAQPERLIETAELSQAPAYAAKEMAVPQSAILFVSAGIPRRHPDFYAAYVLTHMLGGSGLTSILAEAVRQEEGLSYSVGLGLTNERYASLLQGGVSTRTDGVAKTLEIIETTLAKVSQGGVSEEGFLRAKAYITGNFPLRLDNTGTLAAYLELMQEEDLGMDYLEKRNSYFEAVSHEDVQRLARELLSRPRYVVVVGKDAKTHVKQAAQEE